MLFRLNLYLYRLIYIPPMLYSDCRHVKRHEVRKMNGTEEYIEERIKTALENKDSPTYSAFIIGMAVGRLNFEFIEGNITRGVYDAQYDRLWDILKTLEGGPQ